MAGANMGWWVPVLVLAAPPLLLVLLHLLSRLEDWMVQADERGAAVAALLEQVERPEEVEVAVTRLLSGTTQKGRLTRVDVTAPQNGAVRRRRLRGALARAAAAPPRSQAAPTRPSEPSAVPTSTDGGGPS